MVPTQSYAAKDAQSPLAPYTFERRDVGPKDVHIDIAYCGVCHSDLHQARDEWGGAIFPMVPGHEIVGYVKAVGRDVKKFKKGDVVGVGCYVDACGDCHECHADREHFCEKGAVATYNSYERDGKTPTFGGYSTQIVVHERFVLRVPANLALDRVAPLLCAGITTYSPLKRYKVRKGTHLAVVGLGGLGHMAVKLGVAMGADVTVLSTSPNKKADAERLGAQGFAVVKDASNSSLAMRFDVMIDSVSAQHDINNYLNMLRPYGTMVLLGVPPPGPSLQPLLLIGRNRQLAGSLVGGIAETQEMLDYCGKHNVMPDVEMINIQTINEAYERLLAGKVRYRFVIDMKSLRR